MLEGHMYHSKSALFFKLFNDAESVSDVIYDLARNKTGTYKTKNDFGVILRRFYNYICYMASNDG
jgi:hypothetical protein